jgi:isoleucyl-tRNA synthetase
VPVGGEPVELSADEVLVTETPRSGWAVAAEAGETVALDLAVTPQLRRAGLAREAVRLVQEARKASGLAVTDRIALWWSAADPELAAALREHGDPVAAEVLATSYTEGEPSEQLPRHGDPELGLTFALRRV